MGRRAVIWKYKLENYILNLFKNERKTIGEIPAIIKKEKNINISREAVRNFINGKTQF